MARSKKSKAVQANGPAPVGTYLIVTYPDHGPEVTKMSTEACLTKAVRGLFEQPWWDADHHVARLDVFSDGTAIVADMEEAG